MKYLNSKLLPPFFRFVMEITSWLWMFLTFWYIGLISVISLAILNVDGDKVPLGSGVKGIAIPGPIRVLLEVITGTLGIIFALHYLGTNAMIIQMGIVILYLLFDLPRLLWMVGARSEIPEYISYVHSFKK